MVAIPQDASLEVRNAFRGLNDEIRSIRKELSASKGGPDVDISGLQDAIAKAAQSSGPLDVNDTFRGSGGAHSIGLVPDPGADIPTYNPPNRFLHESGKWLPPVASSFRIGNDPELKHNIPGHLNVQGGLYCSKLTTGAGYFNGSVSSGGVTISNKPGCWLTLSGNFTHNSTGNLLSIPFNTANEDNDSMADVANNRLVCRTPGIYLLWLNVLWGANATGTRLTSINVGGAAVVYDTRLAVPATWSTANGCSVVIRLAAGNLVTWQALQASGGNLIIQASITQAGAAWLRP
jgi:hypothetical protein